MNRPRSHPFRLILSSILLIVLVGCVKRAPSHNPSESPISPTISASKTQTHFEITAAQNDPDPLITPTVTPTAHPFPYIYNCEMQMKFTSGPLAGKSAEFTVLGEEYFDDKGDLFYPGEKTAVFYDGPNYLILHSAFQNGNALRPLEAEFLRQFLEYWGDSGKEYIQTQMDALIGSEIEWTCNGQMLFRTKIKEIIRLSAVASEELWQDPIYLRQILLRREGLVSEWIGEMDPYFMDTFYLGFCGWGPENTGDERYTYFRYLINFDMIYAD